MNTKEERHDIFRDWKITVAAGAIWLTIWVPAIVWQYVD